MTTKILHLVPVVYLLVPQIARAVPPPHQSQSLSTLVQVSTIVVNPSTSVQSAPSTTVEVTTIVVDPTTSVGSTSSITTPTTTSPESSASSSPSTKSQSPAFSGTCTPVSATTTISAPAATTNVAPIAGKAFKPDCSHLWANHPAEDWLFATLCSWANSNPNWTLSNLNFSKGEGYEFKDTQNLPAMNFTIYLEDMMNFKVFMMSYEGVSGDGNSDPNNAWWGGGFRNALLSTQTEKGSLFNSVSERAEQGTLDQDVETKKKELREMSGYYGLLFFIGMSPIREDPSQINEIIWNMCLDKSAHSPITILTKGDCGCLPQDRYFSVTHYDKASSEVTLWDPTAGGSTGYLKINSEDLREDALWLFHLDWPRWYQVPRVSSDLPHN